MRTMQNTKHTLMNLKKNYPIYFIF
uniref:Uncharacterized protein n=1 Tax=Anguilla anguilla TaxID=7936 RepID=A0A0E9V0X6_ANGAN